MDQATIERVLKGVDIDGQNYNPMIADAFEHMKANAELVAFLQDDASAYQAYLALRDTGWRLHDGQEHMFGWINCSSLVSLLRGRDEHQQKIWGEGHERDASPLEPETVARFDELLAKSGWTVVHRTLVSEVDDAPEQGM